MYFGQDIGAMIEARNAREWEEQNTFVEPDYNSVDLDLGESMDCLIDACKALAEAANEAEGTSFEARIKSLFGDLETIQDDIMSLRARLKEVKSA